MYSERSSITCEPCGKPFSCTQSLLRHQRKSCRVSSNRIYQFRILCHTPQATSTQAQEPPAEPPAAVSAPADDVVEEDGDAEEEKDEEEEQQPDGKGDVETQARQLEFCLGEFRNHLMAEENRAETTVAKIVTDFRRFWIQTAALSSPQSYCQTKKLKDDFFLFINRKPYSSSKR
jgi:hypothetical protein